MRHLKHALLALSMTILAGCISGCATTPQAVLKAACDRTAQYSTERCAKGIAELYEVYQEWAEDLVTDPLTPVDVKVPIKRADATATPVLVELLKATGFYLGVKAELAAGTTTDEKLAIANAKLEEWVAKALPLIDNLGKAVGDKK